LDIPAAVTEYILGSIISYPGTIISAAFPRGSWGYIGHVVITSDACPSKAVLYKGLFGSYRRGLNNIPFISMIVSIISGALLTHVIRNDPYLPEFLLVKPVGSGIKGLEDIKINITLDGTEILFPGESVDMRT
jgi:hypothetical protein